MVTPQGFEPCLWLQRDRGKIEAEAGDTLPKEEVRAAMLELHSNSLNKIHHIDDATSVEDYEKTARNVDDALATLLDPGTRETLADLAAETGVPAVVFLNVAVGKLVGRHLPSHGVPTAQPR